MATDITGWNSFVEKMARAKKDGNIQKMSMPAIIRLLYCGCFDSLAIADGSGQPNLEAYHKMFADIKKSLKSSATLPKKAKNDVIGLADVKNQIALSLWRYTVNPSGVYPFIHTLKDKLSIMGFAYEPVRERYSKLSQDKTKMIIASDDWRRVESFIGTPFWKEIEYGRITFALPGIITSAKVLWNKDRTKERMAISIYTGKDEVKNLVLWPKYGEARVNPYMRETIKEGGVYLLDVKPSYRDGKLGGSVLAAQPFGIR